MPKHKFDNMRAQRLASNTPTLVELAKKAVVGEATIVRIENGDAVDPHVGQKIADALGVSLATLGKRDL